MNYYKKYFDLIESRKILNRNKKTGIYEKHHIKDKYNEPTPAELKKIITFCESNNIEYKGTFDLIK
jgi:hypothetical protein